MLLDALPPPQRLDPLLDHGGLSLSLSLQPPAAAAPETPTLPQQHHTQGGPPSPPAATKRYCSLFLPGWPACERVCAWCSRGANKWRSEQCACMVRRRRLMMCVNQEHLELIRLDQSPNHQIDRSKTTEPPVTIGSHPPPHTPQGGAADASDRFVRTPPPEHTQTGGSCVVRVVGKQTTESDDRERCCRRPARPTKARAAGAVSDDGLSSRSIQCITIDRLIDRPSLADCCRRCWGAPLPSPRL